MDDDIRRKAVWVDDANIIFRRGLVSCLNAEGFAIAGESARLLPEPDLGGSSVLIFDVDDIGLHHASVLAERHGVRLVGLVHEPREEVLFETITAGLAGVLDRRDLTPSRLTTCTRAVIEGNGSMPPGLLGQLVAGMARGGPRGAAAGSLASRELNVLRLIAQGVSTSVIAGQLAYSERTVKNIVHDVLVKLNCHTRAHAVSVATRQGYI
jgi:DNA-binding NarL/FixJ family response regulator